MVRKICAKYFPFIISNSYGTISNMSKLTINLQVLTKNFAPQKSWFRKWIVSTLPKNKNTELTIRIVNCKESQALNKKYRGKNHPTNILSFATDNNYLGDLVICALLVKKEAQEQNKPLMHHWAHLTIHGVLHLLGYDHHTKKQAQTMEELEIKILKKLKIGNPY